MAAESLYVHVRSGHDEIVLAGQCIRNAPRREGAFRYSQQYLANSRAFALDPINLPLEDTIFYFPYDRDQPGMPGVLLDAGPDDWGKKVLRATCEPPPTTDIDYLLAASGTGIGCLLFTRDKHEMPTVTPERPFRDLEEVVSAAERLHNKQPINPRQTSYFRRGSSLGGARPKTLIAHDGAEWLAKFSREDDAFDNPLAEYVTMTMAREAGIETPEIQLVPIRGGNVLLIKRFDQDETGRISHMLSIHSLINCFSIRKRTEEDFSYVNIAHYANTLSGREVVNKEIFRRMVFNIATGNTDDHMRNHGLIRHPGQSHYRLSPAYDLVPNPVQIGSHSISIGPMGSRVSVDNIMGGAKQLGIECGAAIRIMEDVRRATGQWRDLCRTAGMAAADIAVIGKAVDYGCNVVDAAILSANPSR